MSLESAMLGDIAAMLRDAGTLVQGPGGATAYGLIDSADEMLLANGAPAGVLGRQITLTLATDALALTSGDAILVGSARYTVRDSYQLDDGQLTRITCARA